MNYVCTFNGTDLLFNYNRFYKHAFHKTIYVNKSSSARNNFLSLKWTKRWWSCGGDGEEQEYGRGKKSGKNTTVEYHYVWGGIL